MRTAAPPPDPVGPEASEPDSGGRPAMSENALRALARLVWPYRATLLGLGLLIAASAGVAQIAPLFIRYVFDEVIPAGEARLFLWTAVAYLGYHLVSEGLKYAAMLGSFAFTQRVVLETRASVYERLLSLPVKRFVKERSGSLVSRVVNDVNALESMLQAGATRIVGHAVSIVVVLTILFMLEWRLALIAVAIVAVMGLVTIRYQGPLRKMARRIRGRVGEMASVATEAVQNIAVVKAFTAEPLERRRFGAQSRGYYDLNLDRRRQVGKMQAAIGLSSELGVAALVLGGGWLLVQGGGEVGGLTIGTLTAFVLYLNNLINPVRFLLGFQDHLQAGVAALERIDALMHETPEPSQEGRPFAVGDVELRGVHFRYPGAKEGALNGVDLKVPRGATAALVGPSGAGKSTITQLLLRLHDPTSGTILIGGVPLPEMALRSLRQAVAVVPQEPTLFSGSVAENVRYGRPEASDQEVHEAIRLANAEQFVGRLPQGIDTEIGERGVKLSGGQKQRVAIARALLKGARILLLDEATSSLDAESEALIQDALAGVLGRGDLTTLVIAHRLSTVQDADTIFVLQEGQVVESGSHRELLAAGGAYAELVALQRTDDRAPVGGR